MSHIVSCVKLGREAEGLAAPPYPGELGKRIYENVSKEAWQQWLTHQTMLINEYRLTPFEPKAPAIPRTGNGEILLWRRVGNAQGLCAACRRRGLTGLCPRAAGPVAGFAPRRRAFHAPLDGKAKFGFNARLRTRPSRNPHEHWPGSSVGRAED